MVLLLWYVEDVAFAGSGSGAGFAGFGYGSGDEGKGSGGGRVVLVPGISEGEEGLKWVVI